MTATPLLDALRSASVVDLGQPFHAAMPQPAGAPRFTLSLWRRHGDVLRGDGYSAAIDLLTTTCHAGTHIDAIGHISVDGRLHGDRSAAVTQTGPGGLRELGIETVAPIVRRGVLADVAAALGVSALEPGFGISGDLLQAALDRRGSRLEPGDVLLVRTGWGRFWNEPDRYLSPEAGLPGVDADGATWIAEQGVSATGADCLMYERFDPGDNRLPVHSRLIRDAAIHLIENMQLEGLSAVSAAEFGVVVLPLPLVGATGSQVRPIALV